MNWETRAIGLYALVEGNLWLAGIVIEPTRISGTNCHPHLTVGIGTREFVDALKAEPSQPFTVRADSASLYQLVDYSAAQRTWRRSTRSNSRS